jgi:hypothetical protein
MLTFAISLPLQQTDFTGSHLKISIFGRDQGEPEDQPTGILKYVEDLRREFNADIGRKDFFEMASMFTMSRPRIAGSSPESTLIGLHITSK